MAQNLTPFSIAAPGFFGLNTADSPVDLAPGFALEANNCVIDKAGRVASRKGWTKANTTNSDLGTANITCIGELVQNDGTKTILAAGNGYLFKLSGTTLVTLTYGGGGFAPTISANNWQFVQLNGHAIFFQRGYDPLIYDPAVSTTTFRRVSEHASYSGTIPLANTGVSAYGRIWAANTTADKQTVTWSDLLLPYKWTGGSAGSLNLVGVWPAGGDEIVALAAHNNFLYIFGKRQILIYTGAGTPSSMTLQDSIVGIGCVARDSVQNTGEDIIFLANDGVRSIMRTIQEKSAPTRTISRNVNQDIISLTSLANTDDIKSGYSSTNTFYLLTFPASATTYCFDTRVPLDTGAYRTTTWSSINPKAFCETKDGQFYMGKAGYIGKHTGYSDDSVGYRLSYFTTWLDFGNVLQTTVLKKAILTLIGLSNQTVVFKWAYDYITSYYSQTTILSGVSNPSEYGAAEFGIAEYSGGDVAVRTLPVNGSSSGKVLQFGLEAQVDGSQISIQRIDLYSKEGRLQ